jgi:hypothetical protein
MRGAFAPGLIAISLLGWLLFLFWPVLAADPPRLAFSNPDGYAAVWGLAGLIPGHAWGPMSAWIEPGHLAPAVPAGFLSLLTLSPLASLLGAAHAWNLAVVLWLCAGGLAMAWLCREHCGSWGAGALASFVLLAQPNLLQLVRDGAVEHLGFWAPLTGLACVLRAIRLHDGRCMLAGALLLSMLPVEHPYGIAYLPVLGPALLALPLWKALRDPHRGPRPLAGLLARGLLAALPLLAIQALFFSRLDLANLAGRAADVAVRNSLDPIAGLDFLRRGAWLLENPQSTAALPHLPTLGLACLLALPGLSASLPALLGGLLALLLAFGPGDSLATFLSAWGGPELGRAGAVVALLNGALGRVFPFSFVRFPRRWALLGVAWILLAACEGLARALSRLGDSRRARLGVLLGGILLGLGSAQALTSGTDARAGLPSMPAPEVEACAWIAHAEGSGAVLLLPTREMRPGGTRSFADLDPALGAFSRLWVQVLHDRPQRYDSPLLQTVPVPARELDPLNRWLELADQVSVMSAGTRSTSEEECRRLGATNEVLVGRMLLRAEGYRWILVERASYPDVARACLEALLGPVSGVQAFEDGSGLLVYEL